MSIDGLALMACLYLGNLRRHVLKPAIADEAPEVGRFLDSLKGARLSHVTYVYPESWVRTDEYESNLVDEVDMDIVLHFAGAGHLKISWAMAGLVEGLELSRTDLPLQRLSHLEVSASPQWARLIGEKISEVRLLWRAANAGVPESIWWMGFTFSSGASFSIALGEIREGIPDYQPDELLVFFDELQDLKFRKLMSQYWP
jgi:hypothetical protein